MKDRIKEIITKHFGNGRGSFSRFAEALGVDTGLVGNWTAGRQNPSASYRKVICDKLNISQAWLDSGEGEMLVAAEQPAHESVNSKPELTEREIGRLEGELLSLREAIVRYEKRLDKYDIDILAALKTCSERFLAHE